jgi:hypothetical protein
MNKPFILATLAAVLVLGGLLFIDVPRPYLAPGDPPQWAEQIHVRPSGPFMVQAQDEPPTLAAGQSWVYRADEIQKLILQWVTLISVVGVAIVGALATIWARFETAKKDLRERLDLQKAELGGRMDRQSLKSGSLETRLTALALATPGASPNLQEAAMAAGDPNATPKYKPGHTPAVVVPLAALILGLAIGGCAMTEENRANWRATGSFLAQKAAEITTQVALNSAANALDLNRKADYGQALGDGLRTLQGTAVTANDVKRLVDIWTPEKPEWEVLAQRLAVLFAQNRTGDPVKDAKALESIAVGVQGASMEAAK